MTRLSLIAFAFGLAATATAEDMTFLVGPEGELIPGIAPDSYLAGSRIDQSPYEWCFWPLGCIGETPEEFEAVAAGDEFDLMQYRSDQLDLYTSGEPFAVERLIVSPDVFEASE